jgi:hypothetical protein
VVAAQCENAPVESSVKPPPFQPPTLMLPYGPAANAWEIIAAWIKQPAMNFFNMDAPGGNTALFYRRRFVESNPKWPGHASTCRAVTSAITPPAGLASTLR